MIMKDKMDFEIYEMDFESLVSGLIYDKIDIAISYQQNRKKSKKNRFSGYITRRKLQC